MATPAPNNPMLLHDHPTQLAHLGLNIEMLATSSSRLYTPEETLAPEQIDTMPPAEIARAKNPGTWAYKHLLEHLHKACQSRNLIGVNGQHLHNLIRKGKSQSKLELIDHQHAMILPARKKKWGW